MNRESAVALQVIYTHFRERGGQWPTFGYFERWLSRYREEDALQVINRIPSGLLRPLTFRNGRPDPVGKLVLTAAGVARCLGSDDDTKNLVAAVEYLVRHDRTYDPPEIDPPEIPTASRVPVSSDQITGELSLPLQADPKSGERLMALLKGEGLVMSDEHS